MQHSFDRTLSRRLFVGRSVAAAAGSALLAGSVRSAALAAQPKAMFPAGRYVDMHTHIGTVKGSAGEEAMTPEGLLRWMDSADVSQAVVLPLVSPESFERPVSTEFVLDQTRPYRDRLIPFCSIDPRNSWVNGKQRVVARLQHYKDAAARGFGEHKPGVPVDDERNMILYEACGEVGLPVLFHMDTVRNTDKPGLPGLEKVLQTYPQTVFIGHGPGWWASISAGLNDGDLGGYPRGPVQPGGAIDRLMDKYDNIHGDLSAGSGTVAITRDLDFAREFLVRRADRLMFGTDYLSFGQNVEQPELYRTIELPAEVQAKIFRDNARNLLGLA